MTFCRSMLINLLLIIPLMMLFQTMVEPQYHLPSGLLDEEKENVDPAILEFLAKLKYDAVAALNPLPPQPYDGPRRTSRPLPPVNYDETDLKMLADTASRRPYSDPIICEVCGKRIQRRHKKLHARSRRHRRALSTPKLTQA